MFPAGAIIKGGRVAAWRHNTSTYPPPPLLLVLVVLFNIRSLSFFISRKRGTVRIFNVFDYGSGDFLVISVWALGL